MISQVNSMSNHISFARHDDSEALWSYWRRFESPWNVEKFLSASGRGSIADNATAISYCVKQASDLYRSASNSSLLARPILLFYGMMALLKALILGNSRIATTIRELDEIERTGHGVKLANWRKGKPWYIDQEEVVINEKGRGFFPFVEHRLNEGSHTDCFGLHISIKELLGLLPEIAGAFQDYYGEQPADDVTVSASFWPGALPTLQLRHSGSPVYSIEDFFSRFPGLTGFVKPQVSQGNSHMLHLIDSPKRIPGLFPLETGGFALVPKTKGYFFPRISVHYLLMYALSIIARYKIDLWGTLLEGRESGIGYVIFDFLDSSATQFPRLVLEKFTAHGVLDSKDKVDRSTSEAMDVLEDYFLSLSQIVEATDPDQRMATIQKVGRYREAAPLMRALLLNDPDPRARVAALRSGALWVWSREPNEDFEAVVACLQSEIAEVRAHAADRLSSCRDESAIPLLGKLLGDQSETSLGRVCEVARAAMSRIAAESGEDKARGLRH